MIDNVSEKAAHKTACREPGCWRWNHTIADHDRHPTSHIRRWMTLIEPDLTNPGVATALYRLALAIERKGETAQAAADLADALRPDEPEARARRAR